MLIDLRSDTVTKPSKAMLDAMLSAEVGDDVFGEDPTVIALEKKAAGLFGKEAALFCPSGTMTNQVAIKVHTNPGDEVVCDRLSHIYNYEAGGIAFNSGCSIKLMSGDQGRFTAVDVANAINPDNIHYAITKLVAVENTCNKGGGSVWSLPEIEKIAALCTEKKLKFHLDGARIFNALLVPAGNAMSRQATLLHYGKLFDSISICLSKGMGAPAGSLLIGDKNFIAKARRVRKVFGGGMRQAGYLAAAGIYALENNIERLKEDHERAKALEAELAKLAMIKKVLPAETNIVIFELEGSYPSENFISLLQSNEIRVISMGPQLVRMVTHLDFTDAMLERVVNVLRNIIK